jgi:hypothetical protein
MGIQNLSGVILTALKKGHKKMVSGKQLAEEKIPISTGKKKEYIKAGGPDGRAKFDFTA